MTDCEQYQGFFFVVIFCIVASDRELKRVGKKGKTLTPCRASFKWFCPKLQAYRTGVIFLRFSAERRQALGEREARVTREGRNPKKLFFAHLPSCVTPTSRRLALFSIRLKNALSLRLFCRLAKVYQVHFW